jgi:murein DD-endopeptidase MepM/ murein hydrolase activator NlpD
LGAFFAYFASSAFPFEAENTAPITGLSLPSVGSTRAEEPVLASSVITSTIRREDMGEALAFAADPTAVPTDEPLALATPGVPFHLYTVAEGDTASSIAARFGIDLQYLLWANPDLRDGELLTVGQMLIIPSGNGILHHTRYGETLSDIAERYGVTVEQILAWQGNSIGSPDAVLEDQLVFIPEGVMPVSILPSPTPLPEEEEPGPVLVAAPPPPAFEPPPAPPPAPVVSSGLIWPVSGPISSYMDASHPLGIDIDLYAAPYAPIVAATSGTVMVAGGNPCCSYGLYVVVLSPDGIETLYAHLSSIAVSVGQTVSQGQQLGNGGCTGYCTGNHLHFEVIDNGVRVDPLAYLP